MAFNAAILASLKLSMPGFKSKLGADMLDELAHQHKGESEAFSGSVVLAPKSVTQPLRTAYWSARNGFRAEVLPFPSELAGTSAGLVTAAYFPDFSRKMRTWEQAFQREVEQLVFAWPEVLAWQQRAMGDAYDPKFAISAESLRERCAFTFGVRPIPSGDALPQAFQHMGAMLDAEVQVAMEQAQAKLLESLLERVRWLAETLGDEEAIFDRGRGGRTPREKMRKFVDSLPSMSLVPEHAAKLQELADELLTSTALLAETETLRRDKAVRAVAAEETMATVKKIESLMAGAWA